MTRQRKKAGELVVGETFYDLNGNNPFVPIYVGVIETSPVGALCIRKSSEARFVDIIFPDEDVDVEVNNG